MTQFLWDVYSQIEQFTFINRLFLPEIEKVYTLHSKLQNQKIDYILQKIDYI